jgi:hypothetical protein
MTENDQSERCAVVVTKETWPYVERCRNTPRKGHTHCERHKDFEQEQ